MYSTQQQTPPATANPPRRIMRIEEVLARIGVKRTSLYAMITAGQFPAPKKLTPNGRASGFDSFAVEAWINSKLED